MCQCIANWPGNRAVLCKYRSQQLFTVISSGSGTYEFRALESDFAFPTTNVKCIDVQGGGGSPPNATPIINFPCHPNSYLTAPNQTFFLDANPGTGPVGRYFAPHDPRRGRLLISHSDGTTSFCSGTVVAAPNKSTVATAKHCVKKGNGATMTGGWFVPGYDMNINPPYYQGFYGLDAYAAGSTDTAFIKVGGKFDSNWSWNGALVENTVGSFSPAFVGSAIWGESVRLTGNPSNNGATQMAFTCEGGLTFTVTNSASPYSRRCNGGPGISGSGWIIANFWRAATSSIEATTIGSIYGSTIDGVRYVLAPPALTASDLAAFNSVKN
jgi:hypothetical protein